MFGLVLYCAFSSVVSHLQAGSRWYRDAGGICSRGQILHWIPPSAERRADHPGELPQPDHTGNNPSPSKVSRVNQWWMLHLNWPVWSCCFPSSSVAEWQHYRTPAEGRLRPLRGLVHGCLHPGSRETQSCWTVGNCWHTKKIITSIFCLCMFFFFLISYTAKVLLILSAPTMNFVQWINIYIFF